MKGWRHKILLVILLLIPTFSIQADPCNESMAASGGGDTRGFGFARPESTLTTTALKVTRIPHPGLKSIAILEGQIARGDNPCE